MALLLNPLADARSMALLHHNIVSSRSAMSLAGARSMALLHHNIVSSRSAMSLAGARSMALLHNAPRITANHSLRCATVKATVKATVFFRAT
jgi:hypothetical protein